MTLLDVVSNCTQSFLISLPADPFFILQKMITESTLVWQGMQLPRTEIVTVTRFTRVLSIVTMPGDIPELLKFSQSMLTDNVSRSQVM